MQSIKEAIEDLSVRVAKFVIAMAITFVVYAVVAVLRWPDVISGVLGVVVLHVVFNPPTCLGADGVETEEEQQLEEYVLRTRRTRPVV
jgi:sugar phosphate permease